MGGGLVSPKVSPPSDLNLNLHLLTSFSSGTWLLGPVGNGLCIFNFANARECSRVICIVSGTNVCSAVLGYL